MTIETYLASQTQHSRRQILAAILKGQVRVNGKPITSIAHEVVPNKDQVRFNGDLIPFAVPLLYYKFNKPRNVISTLSDPKGRVDLRSFLKGKPKQLFPVGRLDRLSKGLLLFTNDGQLAYQLTHPKFHLEKTYEIILDNALTPAHAQRLSTGIMLDDGPVQLKLERLAPTQYLVRIAEGRNRILRRSFDFFGYTVKKLNRLAIGPVELGNLAEGEFAELSKKELARLREQLPFTKPL